MPDDRVSAIRDVPVCVDGRMADWPGGTGVATYAATLIATLRSIGRSPRVLDDGGRAAWHAQPVAWALGLLPGAVRGHAVGTGFRVRDVFRRAQAHFDLYGRLLEVIVPGPPGVMHWTYPLPLRVTGWRNVYTVHDVVPVLRPELTTIDGDRQRRLLTAIAARADGIVAVSEIARTEIAAVLAMPIARVANLSQAVADEPMAVEPVAGLAADSFLLFCGSVDTRKNIVRIVAAHRLSGTSLPLVVAGPVGTPGVEAMLAATDGVTRLPHLPRPAILRLIADARALLFVTLDEGFGLPIAEAMRAGTCVVTANRGAAAEVGGDAVLTVDPENVDAIAGAIRRLCDDGALRRDLMDRGRERARLFAVPTYGGRLLRYYEGLADGAR